MKTKIGAFVLAIVMLTGCSSWQGQVGKRVDHQVDDHGRVCTIVKWGESASIDCDYPLTPAR